MDILEVVNRKLANVSKNKNLTEEEKEMYIKIFIQDVINNLGYERAILNEILHTRKK